ncbi:unnamed protein product [Owenia fusiformis]|uniref:Uncharacterized protein n=1 Tax=Owenia fusiformis TaxID=6347 RepID=A0A8J1UWF2_OWEFU|nr:unnamed protein product [Owenia fusiformis]
MMFKMTSLVGALMTVSQLIYAAQGAALECPDGYYFTNSHCILKETSLNPETCPLSTSNPPENGKASCQLGSTHMWYINVGGSRTDWTKGTDAWCLSTYSRPITWDFTNDCQYSSNEADCLQMLEWAGCAQSTPEEVQLFGIIENQPRIGTCDHAGQFMVDPYNRCKYYQCVWADSAKTKLMPQSMECEPGTTVPADYATGDPCTGGDLPCY